MMDTDVQTPATEKQVPESPSTDATATEVPAEEQEAQA
jgi:hypothetical protein